MSDSIIKQNQQNAIASQAGGGIAGTRVTTVTETINSQPIYPVPVGGNASGTNIVMFLLFAAAIAILGVLALTPNKREQDLAQQNLQLTEANTDMKVRQQICADILRPQPESRYP